MFFNLTLANDEKIRINFEKVESYLPVTQKNWASVGTQFLGLTAIIPCNLPNDTEPYIVKETVQEIDKMVRTAMNF